MSIRPFSGSMHGYLDHKKGTQFVTKYCELHSARKELGESLRDLENSFIRKSHTWKIPSLGGIHSDAMQKYITRHHRIVAQSVTRAIPFKLKRKKLNVGFCHFILHFIRFSYQKILWTFILSIVLALYLYIHAKDKVKWLKCLTVSLQSFIFIE